MRLGDERTGRAGEGEGMPLEVRDLGNSDECVLTGTVLELARPAEHQIENLGGPDLRTHDSGVSPCSVSDIRNLMSIHSDSLCE